MIKFARGAAASSLLAFVAAAPVAVQAQDKLTVKVGGRVNVDYTVAELDDPDTDINGSELRRARVSISGNYGSTLSYKFEVQTDSGGDIYAEDAYLQFAPEGTGLKFKLGQQRTTNSLDEQTSSRFISVIERAAMTDAFSLDRRVGATVTKSGDDYTLGFGVFGENLEGGAFDREGYAVSARGTYNPVKTGDEVVHLGASWRYRKAGENSDPAQGDELFRYRQRPFTHQTNDRIISTSRFAESDNFYGLEAAYKAGPFWAAAEYSMLAANGGAGNDDADFQGYYAEAGMFFGGSRTYKGGKFNRPNVDNPITEGGKGAFALVARYDVVDLDDGVNVGKLDNYVIGADWYPTRNTRVAVNAFVADATDGAADKATGIVSRLYFDF